MKGNVVNKKNKKNMLVSANSFAFSNVENDKNKSVIFKKNGSLGSSSYFFDDDEDKSNLSEDNLYDNSVQNFNNNKKPWRWII